MNTFSRPTKDQRSLASTNESVGSGSEGGFAVRLNGSAPATAPGAVPNSSGAGTNQFKRLTRLANENGQVKRVSQLQEVFNTRGHTRAPLQRRENRSGFPDNLKAGLEKLSGVDLSNTVVHYNSSEPARLGALATTQGRDIHLAPGQERHLGHEGWHAVQQIQNRVKPTTQVNGTSVNDNKSLEQEADRMGEQAARAGVEPAQLKSVAGDVLNSRAAQDAGEGVVQRKLLIERGYYLDSFRSEDARFKNQVISALNKLLQGTGVTAVDTGGVVTLNGEPNDDEDPRYRLLEEIIDNDRTVMIRQDSAGENRTDIETEGWNWTTKSKEQATKKALIQSATEGTNAVVYYDPNTPVGKRMVDVYDRENDTGTKEEMPQFLVLAHELIHAGRAQKGIAATDPTTGERQVTVYEDEKEKLHIAHLEEALTVGLRLASNDQLEEALDEGGDLQAFERNPKAADLLKTADDIPRDRNAISENAIRERLDLNPRMQYETFQQNAFKQKRTVDLGGLLDKFGQGGAKPKWGNIALASSVPIAAGLLYYYFSSQTGEPTQMKSEDGACDSCAQLAAAPDHVTGRAGSGVVQAFGINDRKWSEVTSVEVLREGVYVVRKNEEEALVVKTSADVSPISEAVGAHFGRMLGVNTPQTEALPVSSAEIEGAAEHLAALDTPEARSLVQALQTTPYPHILVMPYIEGNDLNDSGERWNEAGPEVQDAWMREIGKVWLLDLVIFNPDRHGENLRLSKSGELFAIDQVVGPMAESEFGGEKTAAVLSNLPKAKAFFFTKLNAELKGFFLDPQRFSESFDQGVREARLLLDDVTPKHITSTFDALAGGPTNTKLPGVEAALPMIKEAIPL